MRTGPFVLFAAIGLAFNGGLGFTTQPERSVPNGAAFHLADLEQMATQSNPTLTQAAAIIEASQGKALQAGLCPNPIVGYQGEQIGVAGTAGEMQGAFIQQEIVTAGKLRLSRAKYQQETVMAEIQALAQQYRVLNGVRVRFWDVLIAQRLVEVRRDLLKITEDAARTTEELMNVGQANRTDLLQAQVEVRRARVEVRTAEQQLLGRRQQLAAIVGRPDLCSMVLTGRLDEEAPSPDWDKTLCDLLATSPELQLAQAEGARDQIMVRRERAEPFPNVNVRVATGYNYENRDAVADVAIGVRLPLFDRNQGTIRQAQADLNRAQANIRRVELSLRWRFADASTRYQTARISVDDYRAETLPKAKESLDLLMQSFRKRRAAWPQVLVAARNYAQFQLDYLEALHEMRRAEVEIKGLLLVDGLTEPREPTPLGHIDAVPKPR